MPARSALNPLINYAERRQTALPGAKNARQVTFFVGLTNAGRGELISPPLRPFPYPRMPGFAPTMIPDKAVEVNGTNVLPSHQILQRSPGGRTMASPGWQSNAWANAGMLEGAAMARRKTMGWGSTVRSKRAYSGRMLPAQTCA